MPSCAPHKWSQRWFVPCRILATWRRLAALPGPCITSPTIARASWQSSSLEASQPWWRCWGKSFNSGAFYLILLFLRGWFQMFATLTSDSVQISVIGNAAGNMLNAHRCWKDGVLRLSRIKFGKDASTSRPRGPRDALSQETPCLKRSWLKKKSYIIGDFFMARSYFILCCKQ